MGRAHAVQRQVKEEAVEVGVVRDAVAENDRNVAVETFRRSTLLDGDVRNRRLVIHRLFNLPPDPHPDPGINEGVLPGPALSRPASASYVGALRPAWITPPSARCTDVSRALRVGADCQDKARTSSRA